MSEPEPEVRRVKKIESTSVNLLSTMDAKVWAHEFCATTGFHDEEWAHTWFANAIMCGWDHHYWSTPEYKAKIAAILGQKNKMEINP